MEPDYSVGTAMELFHHALNASLACVIFYDGKAVVTLGWPEVKRRKAPKVELPTSGTWDVL